MKSCLHCSKPLVREQMRNQNRYCSYKCFGASCDKKNKELTQCDFCGRKLLRYPGQIKRAKFHYCSRKCGSKGRVIKGWSKKYDSCIQCGTIETEHAGKGFCRPCWDLQRRLSQYNMTISDYNNQSDKQKKQCAICGCEANKIRLGVDHDHATGKVRELLCNNCNTTLGNVSDNIVLLHKMIQYLQKHSTMPLAADMIQPPR